MFQALISHQSYCFSTFVSNEHSRYFCCCRATDVALPSQTATLTFWVVETVFLLAATFSFTLSSLLYSKCIFLEIILNLKIFSLWTTGRWDCIWWEVQPPSIHVLHSLVPEEGGKPKRALGVSALHPTPSCVQNQSLWNADTPWIGVVNGNLRKVFTGF